jgi:two-component system response regulator AlgR
MDATARTVLIVDDEPPARSRLRELVSAVPGWLVAGEAVHGRQALDLCQRLAPDVVLLDIRMPEMDGLEAARHLAKLDEAPAVIFTTAYDDYAVQAFDAQAIGYLVKPVRRERLEQALARAARLGDRALRSLGTAAPPAGRRTQVCVRKGRGLRLVPVADIRYFHADQKYVTLHLPGGEELIDEPLKDLEAEFAERFVRTHRNTLVALPFIDRIESTPDGHYQLWLRDVPAPLPVSRRLAGEVKRRLAEAAAS